MESCKSCYQSVPLHKLEQHVRQCSRHVFRFSYIIVYTHYINLIGGKNPCSVDELTAFLVIGPVLI